MNNLDSPTAKAKEYNVLLQRYENLKEKATKSFLEKNDIDASLINEINDLKESMYAINLRYTLSPHFVLPDPEKEYLLH